MFLRITGYVFLFVATFPLIYYLITLYSSWRFFRVNKKAPPQPEFTPPVSNLKPIRGLDPDAYKNFASLCRQDYPDYELLFCVSSYDDPAVPVIEQLDAIFLSGKFALSSAPVAPDPTTRWPNCPPHNRSAA